MPGSTGSARPPDEISVNFGRERRSCLDRILEQIIHPPVTGPALLALEKRTGQRRDGVAQVTSTFTLSFVVFDCEVMAKRLCELRLKVLDRTQYYGLLGGGRRRPL